MDIFIARQAIFDRQRKLYGYELLFRSESASNKFDGTEAAAATMQVLSNTLMSTGVERLLGGEKAFVNFDHRLLLENMHLTLPPKSIVIELLESVAPTDDLVALCESIQKKGYSLALDDFSDSPELAPLTNMANVIKVDMRQTSRAEQQRVLQAYKPRGVLMLAEKVESYAEFDWARHAGYDLFQGYFFARPVVVRSRQIPAVTAACLQLLREVQRPDLDFRVLEQIIREDVSLTYKLLRYANSAMFQRGTKILSVFRALAALGEGNIRRWVTLATLPMLATDKPGELVKLSLVRARFCERVAELARVGRTEDAFLMGMFSLLDALIDQPLDEALHSINLGKDISEALLGVGSDRDFLPRLLQLIRCYEAGNWDEVVRLSQSCDITSAAIGETYVDSIAWAEQTVHADAASQAVH